MCIRDRPFYMEYETRFNKMQGCIDSYKPVSYTHLLGALHQTKGDSAQHGVEQAVHTEHSLPQNGDRNRAAPVSYTHLDVYKRQHPHHER